MTFCNISLCGYATRMIKTLQPKLRAPELTISWSMRENTWSLSVCCRVYFLQAVAKIEFGVISIKERSKKAGLGEGTSQTIV